MSLNVFWCRCLSAQSSINIIVSSSCRLHRNNWRLTVCLFDMKRTATIVCTYFGGATNRRHLRVSLMCNCLVLKLQRWRPPEIQIINYFTRHTRILLGCQEFQNRLEHEANCWNKTTVILKWQLWVSPDDEFLSKYQRELLILINNRQLITWKDYYNCHSCMHHQ